MPFFMAFLGTDRLCSRWGSDDAPLKLLRNQHVIEIVEEPARHRHFCHKQRQDPKALAHSSGSHTKTRLRQTEQYPGVRRSLTDHSQTLEWRSRQRMFDTLVLVSP